MTESKPTIGLPTDAKDDPVYKQVIHFNQLLEQNLFVDLNEMERIIFDFKKQIGNEIASQAAKYFETDSNFQGYELWAQRYYAKHIVKIENLRKGIEKGLK